MTHYLFGRSSTRDAAAAQSQSPRVWQPMVQFLVAMIMSKWQRTSCCHVRPSIAYDFRLNKRCILTSWGVQVEIWRFSIMTHPSRQWRTFVKLMVIGTFSGSPCPLSLLSQLSHCTDRCRRSSAKHPRRFTLDIILLYPSF
jgi:hypothetical protein